MNPACLNLFQTIASSNPWRHVQCALLDLTVKMHAGTRERAFASWAPHSVPSPYNSESKWDPTWFRLGVSLCLNVTYGKLAHVSYMVAYAHHHLSAWSRVPVPFDHQRGFVSWMKKPYFCYDTMRLIYMCLFARDYDFRHLNVSVHTSTHTPIRSLDFFCLNDFYIACERVLCSPRSAEEKMRVARILYAVMISRHRDDPAFHPGPTGPGPAILDSFDGFMAMSRLRPGTGWKNHYWPFWLMPKEEFYNLMGWSFE